MCDTFAVGPSHTADGTSIFAKNSDREPDETHLVISCPRVEHPEGWDLRCTYVSIPQARATHALVICKPFWIWGAEMGVNEKGLVIGNEALFTRVRPEKRPGLIGMDLLRLALERAETAEEAAEVIIDLLKRYGQSGPCGYRDKKFTYMNSFLIMDRSQVIVLETLGRDYALRRRKDHAVISNGITLASDWEQSSLPQGTDIGSRSDRIMTYFAGSSWRRGANEEGIMSRQGSFSVQDAFSLLRSHWGEKPFRGFNRDVCMHARDPFIRKSQTTGSLVVELHPRERFRIFVTAGSAPCLTPFKPFLPAVPWEAAGRGEASFDRDSSWWTHETMHMNAMMRSHEFRSSVTKRICAVEDQWCRVFPAHAWDARDTSLVKVSHGAFEQAVEIDEAMLNEMSGVKSSGLDLRSFFWKKIAHRNGIPVVG
ncbi:MAG TPA: carcinine hydrolase/isopenicillin-N N-acyltransferase family protein [Deltaproteobacteria bacterium]|nr:carcinine hydrolase/isopenicillin-N N-acyltransferase family protein [Deltaproteobacteria bacterium]HPR54401.1 carcinine hydrolase/isopenicillin-N N-acyltransferase family protein [Deltaproteobacteria bacterium]HXK46270.1 carcinine hydrolase/isopenicillin-N N-acyltransferase family protein [Deltaproteobacteria bacterium]